MNLMSITALSGRAMPQATVRAEDARVQFDTMLYRLMLQHVDFASGITNGKHLGQGMFRELITDFLAQEAARQQSGYGAMILNMSNAIEGGNR